MYICESITVQVKQDRDLKQALWGVASRVGRGIKTEHECEHEKWGVRVLRGLCHKRDERKTGNESIEHENFAITCHTGDCDVSEETCGQVFLRCSVH